MNDAGWKVGGSLKVASKFGAERIAVVGIPRKVNSKPEVSRPGAMMPQVAFLLEEWGER